MGRNFYMLIKGSVYAIRRKDAGKSFGSKRISYISANSADRTPNLSPLMRRLEKFGFEKSECKALRHAHVVIEDEHMSTLYPEHLVLNTMKAPSHFGEVALSTQSVRYLKALKRSSYTDQY